METAQFIEINLPERLQNQEYRQKFFIAEASASIASQLVSLRKRRGLDQGELATLVGTQQPAISRIEKADYQNWSFNTLRKIVAAEDARLRVEIKPAEDVLPEYETQSEPVPAVACNYDALFDAFRIQNAAGARQFIPFVNLPTGNELIADPINGSATILWLAGRYSLHHGTAPTKVSPQHEDKDRVISDLKAENARLKEELAGAKTWQGWAPQQSSAKRGIPAL